MANIWRGDGLRFRHADSVCVCVWSRRFVRVCLRVCVCRCFGVSGLGLYGLDDCQDADDDDDDDDDDEEGDDDDDDDDDDDAAGGGGGASRQP